MSISEDRERQNVRERERIREISFREGLKLTDRGLKKRREESRSVESYEGPHGIAVHGAH